MGSGPRFTAWLTPGLIFGLTIARFPFSWTASLHLGFFAISYGFGRAYDEPEAQ